MFKHKSQTKNLDSYQGARPDILQFVTDASLVLDVGCNVGAVARHLKQKFPEAIIWGIEINPDALKQAEPILRTGFCLNLDDHGRLRTALRDLQFDTIIAGDVLEHTLDPWTIVEILFSKLLPKGNIFISLPNIGHWELLLHWFRRSWPVNPRGIFDDTHRRFFMIRDLGKLAPPGSQLKILSRTFRFLDAPHPRLDRLVGLLFRHVIWLRDWFVFQYILVIRREA